jgi:hypothetical protein
MAIEQRDAHRGDTVIHFDPPGVRYDALVDRWATRQRSAT